MAEDHGTQPTNSKPDHECQPEPSEEEIGRSWSQLAFRKLLRYSVTGSIALLVFEVFNGTRVGFSDVIFSFLICALFLVVAIPLFVVISIPLVDRECREAWAWKIQTEWKDWKRNLVSEHNSRLRERYLHKLAWQRALESKTQTDGARAGGPHTDADVDSPDFGEHNVIFTKKRADAARARIASRLGIRATRGPSELEGMRDSERQPNPLEKRLMAALALKDVRELDRLLEKSPEPGLELENTPPKEEYELCPPQKDGTETVDEQDALVYASMWERLKAFICDFAVIFLAVGLLVVGVNAIEKPAFTGTLILVAYMILAQWIWHTTIGKYLFGLEVRTVSPNRRYPSFWALFSRETGGRLVSMPLLCAGYWAGIGHPRSQAWSDRIAATIVVKRPTTTSIKGLLKVLVIVSLLFVNSG